MLSTQRRVYAKKLAYHRAAPKGESCSEHQQEVAKLVVRPDRAVVACTRITDQRSMTTDFLPQAHTRDELPAARTTKPFRTFEGSRGYDANSRTIDHPNLRFWLGEFSAQTHGLHLRNAEALVVFQVNLDGLNLPGKMPPLHLARCEITA